MGESRPRKGCLGAVLWVIGFAVLGTLAGVSISLLIDAGALERWHRWGASAPQGTVELLLEERGGLCARTSDGEIYAYDPDEKNWDQTECVLAEPGRDKRDPIYEYANPCQKEWPAFSLFANSPRRMGHCIDYSRVYMESNWKTYYALDDKGQVWRWSRESYAYTVMWCTGALALAGAIGGLVVGIFVARWWRRRNRPPDPTVQDQAG